MGDALRTAQRHTRGGSKSILVVVACDEDGTGSTRPTGTKTVVASGGISGNPSGIPVAPNMRIFVVDPDLSNGAGGVVEIDRVTGAVRTIAPGGSFGKRQAGRRGTDVAVAMRA